MPPPPEPRSSRREEALTVWDRRGQGSARYDSAPGAFPLRLLDFDPRGQVVDIAQDTNLVFSGVCEAQIKRVNVASRWTLIRDEARRPRELLLINSDITEQKIWSNRSSRTTPCP